MTKKEPQGVGKFYLEGNKYVVIPESAGSDTDAKRRHEHPDSPIVGSLEINDNRYIIILSDSQASNAVKEDRNPIDILTKRELQIVILIAHGHVNKQIADKLNISEWTVASHMRRIFAKLRVDSRAAMIFRCSNIISKFSGGPIADEGSPSAQ